LNAPAASRSTSNRLPGLEALRGVAAICVLLLHVGAIFQLKPILAKGYLGVDFFLMLSGFLMARVQEPRFASGKLQPWPFIAKRYRRLWPMMAAGGVIGLPFLWIRTTGIDQFLLVAAFNLALLPWFGMRWEVFPLNIPAWTIFFELVANVAHALVLRLLPTMAILAGAFACLPMLWWIGDLWGSLDVGSKPENFLFALPRIFFAYFVGIALSRWWGSEPLLRVPALPAILAMPVLLLTAQHLGMSHWSVDVAFVVIACPLMIAGALRLNRLAAPARLLGQLSFPLFALQMPILQGLRKLGFGALESGLAAFAGGVAGAFLASALGRWRRSRQAMREATG